MASPSSLTDPVKILSTATTTLCELVSPIDTCKFAIVLESIFPRAITAKVRQGYKWASSFCTLLIRTTHLNSKQIPSGSNASIGCPFWVWLGPFMYRVLTPVPISCASSSWEMHFSICKTKKCVYQRHARAWNSSFAKVSFSKTQTCLQPWLPQVVTVCMSDRYQCFYGIYIFRLHFSNWRSGRQESESGQGLDVSISLQLQTNLFFTNN